MRARGHTRGLRRVGMVICGMSLAVLLAAGCKSAATRLERDAAPLAVVATRTLPSAEAYALPVSFPPAVVPLERYPELGLTPVDYHGEMHRPARITSRPWYVGFGVELYISDAGDLELTNNGFGGDVVAGYVFPLGSLRRRSQALSFELAAENSFQTSDSPYIPGGEVNLYHLRLMGGFKWAFRSRPGVRVRPYLTLGGAYHRVVFKDTPVQFDIEAPGAYFGAGLDYYVNETISFGLDGKGHIWNGTSDLYAYNAETYTVSLRFLVHF